VAGTGLIAFRGNVIRHMTGDIVCGTHLQIVRMACSVCTEYSHILDRRWLCSVTGVWSVELHPVQYVGGVKPLGPGTGEHH
jgi:hypothetical protein